MFTDIFASTAGTKQLPWIIERIARPEAPDGAAELASWFAAERPRIEEQILTHGAILFRGTGIGSPEELALFLRTAAPSLLDYVTGNSPRTRIERGVYTSTEYPAPYLIWLHNEMSYSHVWPEKLFFCCVIAPRSGGETVVVADSRELLRRLDPAIIDEFRRRGVMYIRNLHGGNGSVRPGRTRSKRLTGRLSNVTAKVPASPMNGATMGVYGYPRCGRRCCGIPVRARRSGSIRRTSSIPRPIPRRFSTR
jgi:TfdA family taurine catabolism dioxygenase TauD